jgi:Ala-tRNA(Pro) deacylase
VFIDVGLAGEERIVFNGGTHADAVIMRYADFAAITQPIVGYFAKRPRMD